MRTGEIIKTEKKRQRIQLVTLVAVVVLGVGLWVIIGLPVRKHAKAKHDAQVLVKALTVYLLEQKEYPKGDYSTICRLLRGETIDGQNPRKLDYIEAATSEINGKGEIVDPWGSPYVLKVDDRLRAYSIGPNKLDEQGAGDDIVSE